MIVIADSGATKTQWRAIHPNNEPDSFETIGLNPYFCAQSDYITALRDHFTHNPKLVQEVHFYGAGCAGEEKSQVAQSALSSFFPDANIWVASDILGAARALFGRDPGIIAILGTGTNVGYYDGKIVVNATPSLGYILGDEGSGAFLGKELVKQWLYNELPSDLSEQISQQYKLTLTDVLRRVYSEPFPGRFLASFVPFIANNSDHPSMDRIIQRSFVELVEKHICKYSNFQSAAIGVVGSVGSVFINQLNRVLENYGNKVSISLRYPIDRLQIFHTES